MKTENLKTQFKVAVWGGVAGAVVTSAIDLIQSKPFYSTVWFGLKWFWANIISFPIPVWGVILILILSRAKFSKSKDPKFTDYKTDKFGNVDWVWDWYEYKDGWSIENLTPLCVKCNTKTVVVNGSIGINQKCPRCEHHILLRKHPDDVKRIIKDNIDRGEYPRPAL